MLRLADFPACIPHVAAFFISNRKRCQTAEARERLAVWIKWAFRIHVPHSHDLEMAWCLLLCGVFGIAVQRADIEPIGQRQSSVVMVMLGLLHERGLLSVPLRLWNWRAEIKSASVYGQAWLMAYEAVRRRWTSDKSIVRMVRGERIFESMLADGVTFVEDEIFSASYMNLSKKFQKGSQCKRKSNDVFTRRN